MHFVKYLCVFYFLFIGSYLIAAPHVKLSEDNSSVYASRSGSAYQAMIVENTESSGSSAIDVYIPISSDGTDSSWIDREDYTSLIDPDEMPKITQGFIKLELEIKNDSGVTQYLAGAVKYGTTEYKTFNLEPTINTTIAIDDFKNLEIIFPLDNSQTDNVCKLQEKLCAVSNDTLNMMVYFFLTTQASEMVGKTYTSSDLPSGGVYFKIYFSDKLNSASINLSSVEKGDERLVLNYSGPITYSEFYKTFVFEYSKSISGNQIATSTFGSASGSIKQSFSAKPSGAITIKELTNDVTYNFAVGFQDKYQFVGGISNSIEAKTENIKEFLNKHACFLISAGLKEDNEVLQFFRGVRDNILLKFYLGKVFVAWYYKVAPEWAKIVWYNKLLSNIIKVFAYTLYYLLKNWLAAAFVVIASLLIYKRRDIIFAKI